MNLWTRFGIVFVVVVLSLFASIAINSVLVMNHVQAQFRTNLINGLWVIIYPGSAIVLGVVVVFFIARHYNFFKFSDKK